MKALAEQQANVNQQQDAPPDHWTLEVQLRRKMAPGSGRREGGFPPR